MFALSGILFITDRITYPKTAWTKQNMGCSLYAVAYCDFFPIKQSFIVFLTVLLWIVTFPQNLVNSIWDVSSGSTFIWGRDLPVHLVDPDWQAAGSLTERNLNRYKVAWQDPIQTSFWFQALFEAYLRPSVFRMNLLVLKV